MSESKHTPGPYRLQQETNGYALLPRAYILEPQGSAIASLPYETDEEKANAKLIAACPIMLAALQAAEKLLTGIELTDYPVSDELDQIRAAISSAT